MKTIKVTETTEITKYLAIDGEVFDDKQQCEIYEKSAMCLIKAKVKNLLVDKGKDAWSFMGGCDDHEIDAYRVSSIEDADNMLKWIFSICSWWSDEKKQAVVKDVVAAAENNDVVLMGRNCDDEYYYINTRRNIVNNLMNLGVSGPKL